MLNKFKKFGRVLAAAFVFGSAALGTGCIEPDTPELELNKYAHKVGAFGGELELRVITNTNWEATDYPDWISLSTEKGRGSTDIVVSIAEYEDAVSLGRQGTVTFHTTQGGLMKTLTINQGKHEAELEINPVSYTIGGQGGKAYFTVASNTEWEIIGQTEGDWATIESPAIADRNGSKLVTINVAKNPSNGTERKASFVVVNKASNGIIAETFELTQTGIGEMQMILGQSKLNFPAVIPNRATVLPHRVPVITNAEIEKPTVDVSSIWCTVDVKQTEGVWYVEITPDDNSDFTPRECVVSVFVRDADNNILTGQIVVTQDAAESPYLEVLSPIVNLAAGAEGEVAIAYVSNVNNVSVGAGPEWFATQPVIERTANSTNGVIKFKPTANHDATVREGEFTVIATAGGQNVIRTVTVMQQGIGEFVVTVDPSTANLPAGGTTDELSFTVYAHTAAADIAVPTFLQVDGSWITMGTPEAVTVDAGTSYKITFTAGENQHHAVRVGTIHLFWYAGNQSVTSTINVSQAGIGGPQVTIMPTFVTVPNQVRATDADPSAKLALLNAATADINCETISPAGWVTAVANEANTEIELSVTQANPGVEARMATMFVVATQGGDTQVIEITISQPGNGGAEIDIPKMLYNIDATEQEFNIPALALNGSAVALVGYDPEAMFTEEPALNDANALTDVTVKIAANETFEPRTAEVVLLATNGDSHQFYTIIIVQKGNVPYTVPEATVTPDNVVFEADAFSNEAAQDVIIYNSDASFTYTVTTPAWLETPDMTEAVADANGKLTMTLTPNKDNLTATPFVGVVTLLVHNGTKTQEISIPVAMKASLTPVYPSAYSVAFPAEAFGEEMAALVNLVGYDANYEIASVVTRNNWFTVADNDTDGLLTIYPNTPLAGPNVQARTGEIDVVITATNDPDYRVAFTITVVQETAAAANVAYAPAFHTVGVRGNVEKYLDEAGMVVDPTGDKVETWFANPDGLTLEVASGLDQAFVSKATWVNAAADEMSILSLEVQTNKSSAWARVAVVNVVARNSWGNVVGHFPITVMQSGVADPAIDLVAAFVDAAVVLKYASGAAPSDDPTEHTTHYEVDAYLNLADGIVIENVEIVELDGKTAFPDPSVERPEAITDGIGWIKVQQPPFTANDPDADPSKYCGWINYEIIDGPGSGFPTVTGEFVSARVKVTLKYGKLEYVIYQLVTVVAPEVPEIGASLVTNEDTIKSGRTDYTITFADDKGDHPETTPGSANDDHYVAVIQEIDPATDIQYPTGTDAWLADATFTLGGTSPNSTIAITDIPTNENDNERVAAITITLKADNHQDQKITFVLHQEAWPEIGATLAAYEGWITAIAEDTEAAVNTTPIPVGTAGIVFANAQGATVTPYNPATDVVYTDTDAGPHDWLDAAAFMEDEINLEGILKNDDQETSIDRHAEISINLTKTALVDEYPTVFKPQTLTYKLTQKGLLEIGATLVADKGTITALETSTADADTPIAFANAQGATVAGFDKAYVGTATGWMEATAFVEDDINVEGIDKNNSQTPPYADRHAIITINLTKEGYKNQKLTYELTQLAMETIGAAMTNAKGTIEANDVNPAATDYTLDGPIVITNDRDSEYTFAVEYPDGSAPWLDTNNFTLDPTTEGATTHTVVIADILANDTPVDRYAIITITLTHEDYQPQVFTYTLTQLAQPVIGATLPEQVVIEATDTTTGTLIALTNDPGATIELEAPMAPVITYIDDYPGTDHTWLNEATFSVTGDTPNQILVISDIPENNDDLDRHAKIAVTLTMDGHQNQTIEFILTQHLKPAIDASLVMYSGIIEAVETTDVIAFNDDKGATIAVSTEIEYIRGAEDAGAWLSGASFTVGGTTPKATINVTGIATNPSTVERVARIAINLTKEGHRPQTIYYSLTQRGVPEIEAVYDGLYVLNEDEEDTATSYTVVPDANPNEGEISTAGIIIAGAPAWLSAAPGVNPGEVVFTFAPFYDVAPRTAAVSFTLTKTGFADQLIEFSVEQIPALDPNDDPTIELIEIGEIPTLAWQAGSTSIVPYTDLNYNDTPATVVVATLGDPNLSSVVKNAGASVTATAAFDNLTGNVVDRRFTLIATNTTPGGTTITRYYPVEVPQDFYVAPVNGLLQSITGHNQQGSNHPASVSMTPDGVITITTEEATPQTIVAFDLGFAAGTTPAVSFQNLQFGTPPVLSQINYAPATGALTIQPATRTPGTATFDIIVSFGGVTETYPVTFIATPRP